MARPHKYSDETRVCVSPSGSPTLQKNGARRAIIDRLIDAGGCLTLAELDEVFGYSVRVKALALIRIGWLKATEQRLSDDEARVAANRAAFDKGGLPVCDDCDARGVCQMNCGPAGGVDYWPNGYEEKWSK